MERRYYLLKTIAVAVAIITAGFTGGVSATRVAHAINHARYSASSEAQAAAWRTTAYVARGLAHLAGFDAML